jgi:thiamine-phosphate pyrophosphorylase
MARTLKRRAAAEKRLPAMLFFTDPQRTPDPARAIGALPRGAGVVYRAFGAGDAVKRGLPLRRLARARGVLFLVGADEALAAALDADGLHLPERLAGRARRIRDRRRSWLITAAAHGRKALWRAAALGVDAAVLSPVFPSRSPSAGAALGPVRAAAWLRTVPLPAYALGGVTAATAPRLGRSGVCGIAAVEALLEARRPIS